MRAINFDAEYDDAMHDQALWDVDAFLRDPDTSMSDLLAMPDDDLQELVLAWGCYAEDKAARDYYYRVVYSEICDELAFERKRIAEREKAEAEADIP